MFRSARVSGDARYLASAVCDLAAAINLGKKIGILTSIRHDRLRRALSHLVYMTFTGGPWPTAAPPGEGIAEPRS